MNLTIEKLPECRAKLSAEIPADTVKTTRNEVVGLFMNQANLPGFRPGKLPKSVVEKKFKDRIDEEVRERLVRDIITKAVSEEDLELLGIKEVERENFEADGAFSFISELVTKPEVELTKEGYMNIPVEVHKSEFDQQAMDDFMVRIQTNFAEYKEVDRAAKQGDQIRIQYTSTCEGEPFIHKVDEMRKYLAETEEPLEFEIPKEVSPYEPIPGLMQSIVGMKKGESKDIDVDFGEDYHDEAMQNLKVVYDLTTTSKVKSVSLSRSVTARLSKVF